HDTLLTREEPGISERQLGRKIGKHAADFGLDPANPVHRAQLRHLIAEITTSPDSVVAGTFRGRGAVKFFLKGEDVVVTTPTEDFVTILKGGVQNPAVQRALQYEAGSRSITGKIRESSWPYLTQDRRLSPRLRYQSMV